ncbi:hypothetical protein C2G38_2226927 [Gigaspora rosea]|uniref:Uncharacterized protein n=1 Tax=Gigaspora rosea TaxID=44941 RepID=A0A397U156_9GLOM|nr:hypothetical protein C2G38_2226927 [Gigaspora rosea]
MLEVYPYLSVGKQLCHPHYCKIVESDRNVLKKIKIQKKKYILESIESQPNNNINSTFALNVDALTKVLYHQQCREHAAIELDPEKFEYMLGNANPQLELEVRLYLMASGATWEAVYIMASLGYSAFAKTVEEFRKKIQIEYVIKIEQHFITNKNLFHVYNVDDYHSIHENRRPLIQCQPQEMFDVSYLNYRILRGRLIFEEFDQIEALTVHSYADNLTERREERSMNGLKLVGFKEQSLHSVQDYINVLKVLLLLNDKTEHLNETVAPVVVDWPGQIFIQKALHIDDIMKKFGSTCKDIEYRTTIDLLDNLIPTTLDVYAILFWSGRFDEYIESVFWVWTFFLRWKRKNYNKAPLVFLSDLFNWMDMGQPFLKVLQEHLPSFNEYYVENIHSKIRANTSPNATVDNIIKQAYVVIDHDLNLKDTYCKARHYPYNIKTLDFLSNKTSLFLLQYFQNVFYNRGKSFPKLNTTKNTTIENTTIETTRGTTTIDTTTVGTTTIGTTTVGTTTEHATKRTTESTKGTTKSTTKAPPRTPPRAPPKGIVKNINSFLKRIEKGANSLTQEDLDDNEDEEDIEESSENVEEISDVMSKLAEQIEQIKYW